MTAPLLTIAPRILADATREADEWAWLYWGHAELDCCRTGPCGTGQWLRERLRDAERRALAAREG